MLAGARPAAAAAPVVAADPTRPSAIAFSDGSAYVLSSSQVGGHGVCIAFVNHGPRTATKVGLSLAMVDDQGKVLGVEVMYPRGKFPVNERSAFSGARDAIATPNGNCHGIFQTPGAGSTLTYRETKTSTGMPVAAILVSAREIVYDDGTAWRSDNVPQTGDHLPLPKPQAFQPALPAGPPQISSWAPAASPVEIIDVYPTESGGMMQGLIYHVRGMCMSFANRDARTAKVVHFDLLMVDRKGTIAGVETLVPGGTFSKDVVIDDGRRTCASYRDKWVADSLSYKPKDAADAVEIGRIVFVPAEVDFADGSVWHAPVAPAVGTPLASFLQQQTSGH